MPRRRKGTEKIISLKMVSKCACFFSWDFI